jgi:hypothetical protein
MSVLEAVVEKEVFVELGLSEMHMEDMSVLVNTEAEMNDFMNNYWIEKDMQFESIHTYRDNKIAQNPVEFDTFKEKYQKGHKVAALEGLFWHKVHKTHVKMLEKRFTSGTLDLKKVYDWQKKNKKCRMLGLVLQTTY